MASLDFKQYTTVTFDCYGTLIDWESGAVAALKPLLVQAEIEASDEEIMQVFLQLDEQLIEGPFVPYCDVLANLVHGFARHYGFQVSETDAGILSRSIEQWMPFHETRPVLEEIKRRYRIAIISNTDDILIEKSLSLLGVSFDEVITSEQVRCYKPSLGIFEYALERLGKNGAQVLHVAEGLSEVVPARQLGMGSVWVRRSERSAGGSKAKPDLQVATLMELAAQMRH